MNSRTLYGSDILLTLANNHHFPNVFAKRFFLRNMSTALSVMYFCHGKRRMVSCQKGPTHIETLVPPDLHIVSMASRTTVVDATTKSSIMKYWYYDKCNSIHKSIKKELNPINEPSALGNMHRGNFVRNQVDMMKLCHRNESDLCTKSRVIQNYNNML